jgi:hypothetical protein
MTGAKKIETLAQAQVKRYGAWAGQPSGRPYEAGRCAEEVYDSFTRRNHQCYRKSGHGPEGLYCKQHDPAFVASKSAKRSERDALERSYNDAFHLERRLARQVAEAAIDAFAQKISFDDLEKLVRQFEESRAAYAAIRQKRQEAMNG